MTPLLVLFALLAQNPNPPGHGPTHVSHRPYKGGDLHEAETDGVTDGIVTWKNGTKQQIHNGRLGKWVQERFPNDGAPIAIGPDVVADVLARAGHRLPPAQPPSLGLTTATAASMAGLLSAAAPSPTGTTVIDDYVFVTPAQVTKWGGMTSAINQVHLAEGVMNDSLAHSGLDVQQRVVGIAQYDQSGETSAGWNADFTAFATRVSQGAFNAQRAATGFDTITLMRTDGVRQGVCGTAYVLNATFPLHVVDGDCAASNLSYAHECGHTLGLMHNPGDTGYAAVCGPTAVGYSGPSFRTVMSYGSQLRIAQYSSPTVKYFKDGTSAVGTAQTDATGCIVKTAPTVAGWHATVVAVPPPVHTAPSNLNWATPAHTAPSNLQWRTP